MNEKERTRLRALGTMTVGYVELRMCVVSPKIRMLKVNACRLRRTKIFDRKLHLHSFKKLIISKLASLIIMFIKLFTYLQVNNLYSELL